MKVHELIKLLLLMPADVKAESDVCFKDYEYNKEIPVTGIEYVKLFNGKSFILFVQKQDRG